MKRNTAFQLTMMVFTVLLLCSTAALAQDVKYNYMPGTDFSKYHTYAWTPSPGNIHPDQIVDQEIKQAIDSQLAAKGLTKVTSNPDLYVDYQIAVQQQRQWNGWGMGGGLRFGGMASATSSTINIGTLVVDIYDVATKTLIWRGDATRTIDESSNQQKNIEKLDKGVAKMMKNYPPPNK
jgi:hypothetical protein